MDEPTTCSPAAHAQQPRILVVDPNKTNLSVMRRRLSGAGYGIAAADGAAAAIAELHRSRVDLVLAQLRLRDTCASELTRVIRHEAAWRDMPVMMITGRSQPNDTVRAYRAGADDVIEKPFHFEVLIARIERRLARLHSLRALRDDNATLDARIVTRAIEIGDLRDQLRRSEAERQRLVQVVATPC